MSTFKPESPVGFLPQLRYSGIVARDGDIAALGCQATHAYPSEV
jgi:hypothetical protein